MATTAPARHTTVEGLRTEALTWFTTAPEWVVAVHATLDLGALQLPVTVDRAGVVRERTEGQ